MNLLGFGKSLPSELKDPFKAEKVTAIHIHFYNRWDKDWNGTIEFQNGDTKGEQKFQAMELGALVQKMENFIQRL